MDEVIHRGHRSRMRRKFSDFGPRVFDTYELLEMLLYNTVPVKDTNPIAKRLLSEFGSLDGIFSADEESLTRVDGIGTKTAKMLIAAGQALELCINSIDNAENGRFYDYCELGEYAVKLFEGCDEYGVIFLSLDNNMKLIGVDKLYEIDFASGGVTPKPFIDAAVRRAASIGVIVHNHPHGPLCPTEGDRQSNMLVQNALNNIGVFLAEHYVICGNDYLGFMTHLRTAFSQMPLLGRFFSRKAGMNFV